MELILLASPLKYIQHLKTISFHCYHPDLSHQHLEYVIASYMMSLTAPCLIFCPHNENDAFKVSSCHASDETLECFPSYFNRELKVLTVTSEVLHGLLPLCSHLLSLAHLLIYL